MKCKYCGSDCVKNGRQANGQQRYKCKNCRRKQQRKYIYEAAYNPALDKKIISRTKIGVGIRDTARSLRISPTTLLKRIFLIAERITPPPIVADQVFEVDEIKSFVGSKSNHIWIAYSLNRKDRSISSFAVGPRTNETLSAVLNKISNAKRIYTDRLRQYKTLIPPSIHRTSLYGTNHIERHNLTIRTHLKRLTRRTICFSRSVAILSAILKIYFWG